MRKPIRYLTVALVTFVIGAAATTPRVVNPLRAATNFANKKLWSFTAPESPVPAGWQKVMEQRISFHLPADMVRGTEMGLCTYYRVFRNSEVQLSFNYGRQVSVIDPARLSKQSAHRISVTKIDGKKATIAIEPYGVHEFFASASFLNVDRTGSNLRMTVVYKDREGLEVAKQIFRSVKFP